jgi:predicted dehydrogenase
MRPQVKWGLIGPGRIAHAFAQGLAVIDDAELYAVASHNPARARSFAFEYGAPKSYTYEELVRDPQVDAIYISTTPNFHLENTLLCLEAGKPVLCEKPLTVNAGEAQKLIDTARDKKVFLMEAVWTRFLPIYQTVRGWLDEGAIGEVRLMNSTFGFNIPFDPQDRLRNPDLAGGTLIDMGIYPISVSQWVMGKNPSAFSVQGLLSETGTDDLTAGLLKYESGAISQFSSNFISNNRNDFYIYGTQGHIRIHNMYWRGEKATLITADQELTVNKPFRASGLEYETEEAIYCIRNGMLESPGITHAQTLANLELMDKMRAEIGVRYPFE